MNIPQLRLLKQNDEKGLVIVAQNAPVLEAIAQMYQIQSSCVLVVNRRKLIGIVTQTDVMRAIAQQRQLAEISVGQLMSQPVITIKKSELENLTHILERFVQNNISHLPVVDSKGILGVVTLEEAKNAQLEQLSHLLSQKDAEYHASEAKLNDVINNAIGTAIVSFRVYPNYDWEYEYHSIGCETIFGYTSQELFSDKQLWISRVHPQDRETVIVPGYADIFAGKPFNLEYRFYHRDGSLRWIGSTYAARYDSQADCWVVIATNIDISELKQAEAALRQSEERWQLAIAGTDEAIWDWDITTNHTYCSDRWFEMLGYERHQLSSFDNEWKIRLHPDDYDYVMTTQAAYLKQEIASYYIEYRLQCRDGCYRWFRSRAKAVWDEQGNPLRLVGSLADITERKEAEFALHERETMLRNIGDNLPNGAVYQVIRELDGSDRFTYLSAGIERLMEITAEDALRDSSLLYRQFISEDSLRLEQAVNESGLNLSVFDIQLRVQTPKGYLKWLHFRSTPRLLPDKRVAWDGLVVDITEIKLTEEILRQSEARLAESQQVARLGNWDYDLATGKITWSKGLFELFQRDPAWDTPNYEENLLLHHPEDRPKLHQAVEYAISTGQSYKLVLRAFKADGTMMYVEALGNAQLDAQGKVIRLYGTAQDITERQSALIEREQAQAALQESERRFRGIFNNTFQFTGLLTVEGILLEANQTALNFAGIQSQDVINRPFWETHWWQISPQTQEQLKQAIALAAQGEFIRYEVDVLGADNQAATMDFSLRPLHDETGQVVLLIPEGRDISERQTVMRDRQRAEQELQEKEQFLSSIYNGVSHPIFVIDIVDNDFCIVGLNPAYERITGLLLHDIKGKTLQQILPETLAATVRKYYQNCIQAGETISYEEFFYVRQQDTWWITNLTPLRDESSHIYRIIGSSINITEQKRAQQMLELQAVITRNMAEGLCLIRFNDGVIVYTNPKFDQIFGYDAGELIGQHISIINYEYGNTKAIEVHEAIAAAVRQDGEATYEVHNIKKDGIPIWCRATTSVFEHPEYGTVLVAVQQDITEQRQTEEKIKASLKEKEVLLKEIHHRVKNNLGIVSSLLQMQSRRTQDHQASAILRDSQNRIASIALVHEKLYRSDDLANINFAQYIPDLTTHLFDSYNVSSNCIRLNIQVEDVSLDIETAIPCGLIINELVSNALKYAFSDNRGGEIQVKLCQGQDKLLILIVKDNGIGLPAEFDSKKAKTLGLTLVQGLVKQLRGQLEVQSQVGTEFKISFIPSKV